MCTRRHERCAPCWWQRAPAKLVKMDPGGGKDHHGSHRTGRGAGAGGWRVVHAAGIIRWRRAAGQQARCVRGPQRCSPPPAHAALPNYAHRAYGWGRARLRSCTAVLYCTCVPVVRGQVLAGFVARQPEVRNLYHKPVLGLPALPLLLRGGAVAVAGGPSSAREEDVGRLQAGRGADGRSGGGE